MCQCACGAQSGCDAEKHRRHLKRQRVGSRARRGAYRERGKSVNNGYSPHAPGHYAHYPPVFVFAGGQPPAGFHQLQQEAADANKTAMRRRLAAAEQRARDLEQRAIEAECRERVMLEQRVQHEQQMAFALNEVRTAGERTQRFLKALTVSAQLQRAVPLSSFTITAGAVSSHSFPQLVNRSERLAIWAMALARTSGCRDRCQGWRSCWTARAW